MKHLKPTRFLAMLLAFVMFVGCVPMSTYATEAEFDSENVEIVTATVAFDVNTGSGDFEEQTVAVGGTVVKPEEIPTHDSLEFAYWTANLEENVEWNFEENTVAGDMTLYAVWTTKEDKVEATYTVEYYRWDFEQDDYILIESEEYKGVVGEHTDVQAKEYEGLILMDEIQQAEILEDGSTVVVVYYTVQPEEVIPFIETKLYDTSVSEEYFKVISIDTYSLAPGAQEHEIILNNSDGNDRKIVHVFEVDTNNDELEVMPGYWAIDTLNPDDLKGDSAKWKAEQLTKTVSYYENTLGYNVVGAMNTALAYDSNAPYGYMVWNGVVLGTPEVHKGAETYLAINKDGSCELRSMSTPLTGNEQTAISANFGWLVKDGVLTKGTVERTSSDASRSMIGIKADGTLIFCQVDGRSGAVSSGLSNYEMGEAMLALGCVNAVNCDGGGSSTFVSKRAGEEKNTMRSIPSDGSERPTINSVILVSTAGASDEFAKALIETKYDYIAPGASMNFEVTALDTKEFTMEIPEGVVFKIAEDGMGTIENDTFTAGSETGTATIQAVYNGEVVGEKKLGVVHPDMFGFDQDSTVIPYGKTVDLVLETAYGDDDWAVCIDGVYSFLLDDTSAASLDGNRLTASNDETKKGVNVTVTYLPKKEVTDELAVTFGKGSEIIFDFEDGDVSDWKGFVDAKRWSIENDVSNTLVGNNPYDGQFNPQISSETFLATRENGGKVKNGKYALAWSWDYTDADFAGWSYNILNYVGDKVVLRDTASGKNATTLGMWLYIPEGAAGFALQSQLYDSSEACKGQNFTFLTVNGVKKNLNSCTEEDIPESRWVYASVDLTSYDYISTPVATSTASTRTPSIMRTYVKTMVPATLTFYIDDITLDYSSAVEDRILPTITNISYATEDSSVELEDGALISKKTVAFSATLSDNDSVDTESVSVLIDGVKLDNLTVSAKSIASDNVSLLAGEHTVTFEVCDKNGNLAKVTRTFVIAGSPVVMLDGHNDSGEAAEYDSIYYVDLKVSDIKSINDLYATLKLQNANTWELDGSVVAKGFDVSFDYNDKSGLLIVSIERNGEAIDVDAKTIVSIPVRVWSWDAIDHVTNKPITPETQFATGYCPIVSIDCKVVKGVVELNDSNSLGAFGGSINVATNLNDNVNPWHYHDEELTVLNKEADCTEGYEGRTYCETCKSVIDWGTKLPAIGHVYSVRDNELVCVCGETKGGNGLVTVNGKIYCMIADKLVSGWQMVGDSWCYVDKTSKEVQRGEFIVNGLTYSANTEGKVTKGAWVTDSKGSKYSFGPEFYTREWAEIDGDTYYFGTDSYMFTGIRCIAVNRNNMNEGIKCYEFGDDGKFVRFMDAYTGFAIEQSGIKYYIKDGWNYYGGLLYIDGYYYYARTSGEIVCGRSYWPTKTNDLLPQTSYMFDEEGKMINPPIVGPEQPEVKNGVCADENGKLWYYVDDVKTYGGLMYIDGYYYYARTSGEIVCGRSYGTSKTSCGLPNGYYTFDEQGRMINPPAVEPEQPEVPETKNGVCADENGKLWYYVDDVKTYGGLMYIDGYYYYARTSGEIVCGRSYGTSKTSCSLPNGYYTFDEQGRMINPPVAEPEQPDMPETKNGVCADEYGKLWYYVDDVKTYGGLIYIDGYYYYARTSGEIVCGRSYWPTKTNDLLPQASYTFGADGKMVNPPTVK